MCLDCRRVSGGVHRGPHSAEAAQDVPEDQTEAQRPEEAVGLPAEHPTHCSHRDRSGVCGGDRHLVPTVGFYL